MLFSFLVCANALALNKSLIGPEQTRFHEELEQGYQELCVVLRSHGIDVPDTQSPETDLSDSVTG